MTMFGCYCIINVTVLLNLLIAMMNHSYQIISVSNYFFLDFFLLFVLKFIFIYSQFSTFRYLCIF